MNWKYDVFVAPIVCGVADRDPTIFNFDTFVDALLFYNTKVAETDETQEVTLYERWDGPVDRGKREMLRRSAVFRAV